LKTFYSLILIPIVVFAGIIYTTIYTLDYAHKVNNLPITELNGTVVSSSHFSGGYSTVFKTNKGVFECLGSDFVDIQGKQVTLLVKIENKNSYSCVDVK